MLADGATNMQVTYFSFLDQIRSLLDNQWLMTQENWLLSFANPGATQLDTVARGDLNQSRFWHETQMAECTSISNFFAPLVVFIDSTQVDMYGKVNIEPFMFTGGWFNREVCTKAQSWRPLGFIADTKVKSSA